MTHPTLPLAWVGVFLFVITSAARDPHSGLDWFTGCPIQALLGLGWGILIAVPHLAALGNITSITLRRLRHQLLATHIPPASLISFSPPFVHYSDLLSLSACPYIPYPPHCLQEAYS